MDLQKIGTYIAGKRKSLGLTQRELAEKLGMSDKSVSKWERGVCLPDVSVYRELCGILGISLNEFFAGEDLDEQSLPERSEENLLSVSKDGKSRRKRLKRIIAVLAIAALLLGGVLAWVLTADVWAEKNKIVVGKVYRLVSVYLIRFDLNATPCAALRYCRDVSDVAVKIEQIGVKVSYSEFHYASPSLYSSSSS